MDGPSKVEANSYVVSKHGVIALTRSLGVKQSFLYLTGIWPYSGYTSCLYKAVFPFCGKSMTTFTNCVSNTVHNDQSIMIIQMLRLTNSTPIFCIQNHRHVLYVQYNDLIALTRSLGVQAHLF